jgi:hypothetical protein
MLGAAAAGGGQWIEDDLLRSVKLTPLKLKPVPPRLQGRLGGDVGMPAATPAAAPAAGTSSMVLEQHLQHGRSGSMETASAGSAEFRNYIMMARMGAEIANDTRNNVQAEQQQDSSRWKALLKEKDQQLQHAHAKIKKLQRDVNVVFRSDQQNK